MPTQHPFSSPADLDPILALVKARPSTHILDYPGLADLRELLTRPEIQAAARLWYTEAGRFAGYALINHGQDFASLSFEVVSDLPFADLGGEMIAWGERAYRDRFHGQTTALTSSAFDTQPDRVALLEQYGFIREAEHVVYMERDLAQPLPAPRLPPGFTLRPVQGADEDAAWVALHRAAHGTQNMTVDYRRAMTAQPDYDPALDLVAVAPDGTLAAYVFGAYNKEEIALCGRKIGFTDPVATHPAYQRRGLARALLLEGLRRLQQCGLQVARLGTSSENPAMQAAAHAAGFRVVDRAWHYAKSLEACARTDPDHALAD